MQGQPHRTDPEAERGNVVVKGQPAAIHDSDLQKLLKIQKGKYENEHPSLPDQKGSEGNAASLLEAGVQIIFQNPGKWIDMLINAEAMNVTDVKTTRSENRVGQSESFLE